MHVLQIFHAVGIALISYYCDVLLVPVQILVWNHTLLISNTVVINFNYVMLIADPPPIFSERLQETTVMEGDAVKMECRVESITRPNIHWLLSGQPLVEGRRVKTDFNGKYCTLTITRAERGDEGEYRCVARNKNGSGSSKAALWVKQPATKPQFQKTLKNIEVSEGRGAVFKVNVSGKPKPKIKWLHEDDEIEDTGRFALEQTDKDEYTLSIEKCSFGDAGEYTVVATNAGGQATSTAQLTITEKIIVPSFEEGSQEAPIEIWEGAPLQLEVNICGHPEPTVVWFKNDRPVRGKKNINVSSIETKHNLSIDKVMPEDSGIYSCEAASSAGKARKEFRVSVHG